MEGFDHKRIEKKWKEAWAESAPFKAEDGAKKKKTYLLVEFPYPSGEGLHIGHPRSYVAMDVVARKRRRQGENVLYPIGWDAFGLPTENYAIKTGRNPVEITKENTDKYRQQIKDLGISFDWSREINTSDPSYYKWTQWIFIQLFKHGLAYKTKSAINWCPKDKIGLANEEVVNGCCERCGTPVEKREREQWMLAITKYAKRLYDDLDSVDYIAPAKTGQRNWIGPSEGAYISFKLQASSFKLEAIKVFTTRPDTLFGATYVVLSPEHPFVSEQIRNPKSEIRNKSEVEEYINKSKKKTEMERTDETKEKTGVKLEGVQAVNPGNNESLPIFIADYVLSTYGTGAIMAVPAHDERDFAFAKKFGLPVKEVIMPQREYIDENAQSYYAKRTAIHRDLLLQIVQDAQSASKKVVIHGGWGVALHVGREFREIEDIDLYVPSSDMDWWLTYFQEKGFQKNTTDEPNYFQITKQDTHIDLVAKESLDGLLTVVRSIGDHDVNVLAADSIVDKKKYDGREIRWKEHADLLMLGVEPYVGEGALINSGDFTGIQSMEAKKKITNAVGGEWTTTYKLRDWVFSRQRYWGEPIPLVHCEKCGWVAVPESDLPVVLPYVKKYEPTETGDSPLASINEWVNTTCPQCDGEAKRETDVMPNWAGSSWYYLRYTDPNNDTVPADKEKLSYWTPVDWYNGGMEHTTLHLLYSRFWHKFLYDIKVVPTPEPYIKRTSHGFILGEDGEKMSKSRGNVINPDDIVKRFGADTFRTYEMFMGPFDQATKWSTDGLVGVRRFIERVVKMKERVADIEMSSDVRITVNQTIKKVGEDIENLRMNTAVSSLMTLTNALGGEKAVPRTGYEALLKLLAPFAPFVTEELWEALGHASPVHQEPWPAFDPRALMGSEVDIAIQVNGKVRGVVTTPPGTPEGAVLALARGQKDVEKWLQNGDISKVVYIPDKILNIVVKGA